MFLLFFLLAAFVGVAFWRGWFNFALMEGDWTTFKTWFSGLFAKK